MLEMNQGGSLKQPITDATEKPTCPNPKQVRSQSQQHRGLAKSFTTFFTSQWIENHMVCSAHQWHNMPIAKKALTRLNDFLNGNRVTNCKKSTVIITQGVSMCDDSAAIAPKNCVF